MRQRLGMPNRSVLAMAIGLLCPPLCSAAAPNSAEIVSINGKGETRSVASAPWAAAQPKQLLYGGNFVRTLDDSSMALLFSDKSQLKLSRNSMFEVKAVGDGKSTDTTVSLLKGKSWMQSKSVPNTLKVETPSGTAGIHGTDWVLEVDDAGVTTLTVLSGEVEFANAQGSVNVRQDEQAITAPGGVPQKRLLQNSRERVQWVSSYQVDINRYPDAKTDPALQAVREAMAAQRTTDARQHIEQLLNTPAAPACAWLLAADFALAIGEFGQATERLNAGRQHFPTDDRFPANLARAALLAGDLAAVRQLLASSKAQFAESSELMLVRGDLARLDGDGAGAVQAYAAATQRTSNDFRTWFGLGATLAEQENFEPARAALQRAIALAPDVAAPQAELGALETRAHRLAPATTAIDRALEAAPDDFVAWASRGDLLLAQGAPEAALEAYLKAGVLEPRYAKAQTQAAVAWYQQGRTDAALAALSKAKLADPNDPLPYFYEAQIEGDALNPMGAIAAARSAMDRFGFLKSLGPIATDKQGNASLGSAYALFGLETWAKRVAAETPHPFFAGSYLFTAARSTDAYVKNSALVQGYLTDPTLFGASPQNTNLLPRPGGYVAAELGSMRNDAFSSLTPSFIANGFGASPFPVAGFVQADAPRFQSGNIAFAATAPSLTTALGLRPHAQWGVFLYRDEFRPRIDNLAFNTASDRIVGNVVRTDIGTQWQIDPTTAVWLRAGQGVDETDVSSNVRNLNQHYRREESDSGVRFTALRSGQEWTLGLEGGRASKPSLTQSVGSNSQSRIASFSERDGGRLFVSWKGGDKVLRLQTDLDYSTYRFSQTGSSTVSFLSNGRTSAFSDPLIERQLAVWSPRVGLAWSPVVGTTYRLAWQDLMRPATSLSLAALDTAGIPMDVPGLQPGGRLKRLRAQGEWELAGNGFLTAFADQRDINNLHDTDGSLLNPSASLAQYDRLRQQSTPSIESPEALDGSSTFAAGTIQTAGVIYEQIATERLSWTASYVRAQTTNALYPEVPLPRFAMHNVGMGLTWFAPQRWVAQAQLRWRSERTVEDTGQWLDADWDLALKATWQSATKRQLFEISGKGLGRKDSSANIGLRAVWRY